MCTSNKDKMNEKFLSTHYNTYRQNEKWSLYHPNKAKKVAVLSFQTLLQITASPALGNKDSVLVR